MFPIIPHVFLEVKILGPEESSAVSKRPGTYGRSWKLDQEVTCLSVVSLRFISSENSS